MSIFKISVENPVLVNMIMIAVIVLGTYSFITLPREAEPDIDFNWAFIITIYPGASPEEIEKLITIPIEEEIKDVDKIESIASKSSEGASFVSVKFEHMSDDDFDKIFQDLRAEVDKVEDLPADAEAPEVIRFTTGLWIPIVNAVLSGDLPEGEMKRLAENMRDEILDIKDVAKVDIYGVREREIWVEVDPDRLYGYDMSLMQVIQALKARNLNLPAGDVKMGRSEYLIRTVGEFGDAKEIENVILRSYGPGGQVKVRDLADVRDTFEEAYTLSRLDGKRAVTLYIMKKSEGNTIRLVNRIRDIAKRFEERKPGEVKISLTWDSSVRIKDTIKKLETNALMGMALVVVALYVFVGWRNALFAGLGIPVTFMATFLFMKYTGRTLNGNSLFGLVLVLGIIVDDAIVVIENVYRYMQKGYPPARAVIVGTPEVAIPVLSSTLTTVAAFLPLMLLPGIVGKFMKIVPIVVCLALAASVIEAFFILPSHIADWGKVRKAEGKGNELFVRLRRWYTKRLVKVLRRRYWVVFGVIPLLAVGSALLIPLVGVDMFADEEISQFSVRVWMPFGTKLEETNRIISKIERMALELPRDEFSAVVANVGILHLEDDTIVNTHVGEVMVDLVEPNERERTSDEIIEEMREKIKPISGISKLEFGKVATGPPTGKPVEVKVKGKYLDGLREVADLVKAELRGMEGVTDVNDDFSLGKKEIKIRVDEEKAALLGLDVFQIAGTVRTAFEGTKATVFRDGDEEVDVVVKFKGDQRETLSDIERMRVPSRTGALVPFKNVARIETERGYSDIKRFQGDRAITVSADVDDKVTSAVEVNQRLVERFRDVERRYPGYRLDFRGEFQEFKETFSNLGELFVVGVLLIYLILGTQFRSWVQPLVVLFTVPFAFIGAMVGLLAGRDPFSVVTLFGIVALAGVVVNDSIVLMDFINKGRERGAGRWMAIVRAGRLRLRPIILTSVTTICGLLPMAIGLGGKSAVWGPLANTIAWGLGAATFLTLFVIPCLYAIVDDIARKLRLGRFNGHGGRMREMSEDAELEVAAV